MKIKFLFLLLGLSFLKMNAQFVDIRGKISATDEVEGIHIINKTASRFTISNEQGEFKIPAQLNDTLLFSGISYQPKEIVMTKLVMASKQITVYLEEMVNELDQVVIGKVLSGDLMADINNMELKQEINFYNLGIPGYTGKLKTQSERRLYEATSGGLIPIVPLINAISGRTKRLKYIIKLERADECLDKMKADFAERLFSNYELEEDKKAEFFYYCQDDSEFENICKLKSGMAILEFLTGKLEDFKDILRSQKE